MKINDLSKLKFTSIKYGGDIIHFKYDGEDYTLKKEQIKELNRKD